MQNDLAPLIFELSIIVISAASLGTLFLYARQPIILAYIASGMLIGPCGLNWIPSPEHITQIGHLGVILLLFLIGLNLQPQKLLSLFKESAFITLCTSCFFFTATLLFALAIQLPLIEAVIVAAALMFSSTVIGLKLIPTTTLHHKRIGEMMTSILLVQDILAISVIIFLNIGESGNSLLLAFIMMLLKFAALCVLAFLGVRYLILPLFRRFDVIQEYSFITTLGWCLFWAEASHQVGLSYESGAFIAGISIAVSRVSQAISVHLKPLREFFLVLFFFAIGAKMDLSAGNLYSLLGILFGALLIALKVWGFSKAFQYTNEKPTVNRELSVRLSQASEFSFLVVYAAMSAELLSMEASMFIQTATMTTFIISTYWVVKRFPTPISIASHLRQD